MRPGRVGAPSALSLVLLLATCAAPPAKGQGPDEPGSKGPSEALIASFRDYVYAYYEVQALLVELDSRKAPEAIDKRALEARVEQLRRRQEDARARFAKQLGVPAERLEDAMKPFRAAIAARPELALLPEPGPGPISLRLVEFAPGGPRKVSLTIFETRIELEAVAIKRVLVEDYASARARATGQPGPFRGVSLSGATLTLDGPAITELGRVGYWERLGHYDKALTLAADPRSFLVLGERPAELLIFAKDALRARSLARLRDEFAGKPDRGAAFTADFVRRAELQAACELFEALRGRPGPPLTTPEARARLAERALLSFMVHGDPAGALATILGLAAQGLIPSERRRDPELDGARAGTRTLLAAMARLRPAPPEANAAARDALALYELCRASPNELRALALAAYRSLDERR